MQPVTLKHMVTTTANLLPSEHLTEVEMQWTSNYLEILFLAFQCF